MPKDLPVPAVYFLKQIAAGDERAAVRQSLAIHRHVHADPPENVSLEIIFGNSHAILLRHQDPVAGQHAGIHRKTKTADLPVRLAIGPIFADVAPVVGVLQFHHQRVTKRSRSARQDSQIELCAVCLPPGSPSITQLAAIGTAGSNVLGRRLLTGEAEQDLLRLPGLSQGQLRC